MSGKYGYVLALLKTIKKIFTKLATCQIKFRKFYIIRTYVVYFKVFSMKNMSLMENISQKLLAKKGKYLLKKPALDMYTHFFYYYKNVVALA